MFEVFQRFHLKCKHNANVFGLWHFVGNLCVIKCWICILDFILFFFLTFLYSFIKFFFFHIYKIYFQHFKLGLGKSFEARIALNILTRKFGNIMHLCCWGNSIFLFLFFIKHTKFFICLQNAFVILSTAVMNYFWLVYKKFILHRFPKKIVQ